MKSFKDNRGEIKDELVTDQYSVTSVSFNEGAVRGNHYHEKTKQIDILLKGKLLGSTKEGKIVNEFMMKDGSVNVIDPGVQHAYKALEGSLMLSICIGVRKGEDYEKDVVRLSTPLL